MKNIEVFIKKYGIYLIVFSCLVLGLLSLIFKNATLDDDLYLWETSIMADALKSGEWIGNYAVGTHGFLFKLPVAIAFLFTSPSLIIATVWNVILACISLYIFYLFLKEYFKNEWFPLLGTVLLFSNFQFILNLPTYMREVPVLFSLLLFLLLLAKKKPYWMIGLSLMLIFDAKEYVLYMILPAYLIYVLFIEWKGFKFNTLFSYIKSYFFILFPTAVLLCLMIFTQLVPINMYALSTIPGVTKGGIEYHIKHFDIENSTTNRIEEAISIQKVDEEKGPFFKEAISTIESYIGKILYPRSFSFLSIPKLIIFPALFTSFIFIKKAIKNKDYIFIPLALIFWEFLSIFILRASFDRYLFPILPVVFFFFLLFIRDLPKEKKKFLSITIISGLLSLIGLLFEADYVVISGVLSMLLMGAYLIYYIYHQKYESLYIPLILFISFITFSVVAFFFYANGQLSYYLKWGNDYEVKRVVSYFDENEKIILNDVGWDILPKVYRGDNQYNPEWKWEFSDWVPRKEYLKELDRMNTFGIFSKTAAIDKEVVYSIGIDKVGLMVSTLEGYPFKHQEKLQEYLVSDWLELRDTVQLKNKVLYIFEVK